MVFSNGIVHRFTPWCSSPVQAHDSPFLLGTAHGTNDNNRTWKQRERCFELLRKVGHSFDLCMCQGLPSHCPETKEEVGSNNNTATTFGHVQ